MPRWLPMYSEKWPRVLPTSVVITPAAIIAVEFAAAYPELTRKVIASGLIYVDDEVRADLGPRFKQWTVQADGSHLTAHWERLSYWTSPNTALTQRLLLDVYRAR